MTTRQQSDALVGAIREFVQALMRHREGQIAGGEDLTTAQANLRDALRAAFGLKERVEP